MKKNLLLFIILIICGTSFFAQVPNYVPTNGLVGWWPFNGNANDESGNGNNGTVNGASLTTDRFGNANSAYSFDGVDDFVQCTGLNSFDQQTGLTMSLWFKTNNYHNGGLIDRMDNNSGHRVSLRNPSMTADYDRKVWGQADGYQNGPRAISNSIYELNTWTNITVCFSDSVKIYFNGNIESSTDIVWSTLNLNNLVFGRSLPDVPEYFSGQIDDVGIWNRTLTECEIQDLYNAQLGTSSTANETACESYTWNGSTYNQNGQYSFQTSSINGCDSTATLTLTINQPSSSTQSQISLDSYTWPVNGQTYTQSGTYTAVIPNASGCDSTITLDLTLSFTGIDEQVNSKIIISPNPASEYFMIIAPEELIGESYSILDLNGKTLQEGTLTQKEQKIDIGNLSEGMYLFKINNETEQTFRIIKN